MLFNTFEFLIFFPVVTLVYFLLPHKFRWVWLLGASCYFYMVAIPEYILILALTIIVDYLAAIAIERSEGSKRKRWLVVSIVSTCLILFFFKYFNFFNENVAAIADLIGWNYPIGVLKILLPIGLSFHTFQSLSYVIEVYRGNQKAEKHFGIYSLYVMFYPQLVAGPIERPQNMLWQFHKKHSFDYEKARSGMMLILWGLFKKIVIADRLAVYVNEVYNHPGEYQGMAVILATLFFTFQIYCDFSGYTDVAIGAARIMGFDLMLNFNRPYIARTIGEFWRRWHISLSSWLKDYIYFPLGGSRVPKNRMYFNILITFMVSGLWHGAAWTFVIYGIIHSGLIILETITIKSRRRFSEVTGLSRVPWLNLLLEQGRTFALVVLARVLFRAASLNDALTLYASMFQWGGVKVKGFYWFHLALSCIFIIALVVIERMSVNKPVESYLQSKPLAVRWSTYLVLFWCIFIFGNFDFIDYIYFQF